VLPVVDVQVDCEAMVAVEMLAGCSQEGVGLVRVVEVLLLQMLAEFGMLHIQLFFCLHGQLAQSVKW